MIRVTYACVVLAFMAGTACAQPPGLPDPKLTPGATNPAVTQANIRSTICKPGWTKTIRPPVSYTNKLKKQQLAARGYTDKKPAHYEEDHLISLEIGGAPLDPKNLWPEAYAGPWGARVKDRIETKFKRLVCAGKLSLKDAQALIAHDWIGAYKRYVVHQ